MPLLFSIGVLFAKIAAKFGVAASANTIAAGIAGTIKAVAISTAVSVGIELVNRLFRRRNEPSDAPRRTVRIEVADAVWLIGRQRAAASGVLYHGEQGRELRLRLYIAEDECEGIDGVCWVDGKRVKLVRTRRPNDMGDLLQPEPGHELRGYLFIYEYFKADGTQGADYRVDDPGGFEYSSDPWNEVGDSTVWGAEPDYETLSQRPTGGAAEPFQTKMPPWTAAHKVEGKSWVLVRFLQPDYGDDAGKRIWSREPNIEFLVKGLKMTWPGQAVKAWTRNAAAVWFWWLTERRGWSADEIDRADFDAAYSFCEEDVDAGALPEGYTGWSTVSKRYAVDYAIASGRDAESVEEDLRSAWGGGHAVESNGKIYFRPAREREPVAHITPSDIIAAPGVEPWRPLQERINAVNVTLDQSSHPAHEYQQLNISTIRHQSAIDRDGEERTASVRLAAVSDPIAAGRLGTIMLREADESMRQELPVMPRNDLALQRLIPTDVVTVTNPEYGMDRFRMKVEGALHREDWSIVLTLREDKPATYEPTLHLPAVGEREIRIPDDGLSVPALAGLALDEIAEIAQDGTTVVSLEAEWGAAVAFNADLQIRERTDPAAAWQPPVRVSGRTHRFPSVVSGKTYEVRGRHVSILGRTGEWSGIASRTVGGDLTPPGGVALAQPVALPEGFRADLGLPSDDDFAFCQVEYGKTPSGPTVKVKASADFVEILGLDPEDEYRVRVRAIDESANEGAWSGWRNVTTLSAGGPPGPPGESAIGHILPRSYTNVTVANIPAGGFRTLITDSAARTGFLYLGVGPDRPYLATIPAGTPLSIAVGESVWQYEITGPLTFTAGTSLRVGRLPVKEILAGPALTVNTGYDLNFGYALGDPGQDAYGTGADRAWRGFGRPDLSSGGFSVHQNGSEIVVTEGGAFTEDYLSSVGAGSAIWVEGENYRWRAKVTGAGSRIVGTPGEWIIPTEQISVGPDFVANRSYHVVITKAGAGTTGPPPPSVITIPEAPTGATSAADGQGVNLVRWTAPVNDGGSPVNGYRIEASSDGANYVLIEENTGTVATEYRHRNLAPNERWYYRIYSVNIIGHSTGYASTDQRTDPAPGDAPSVPLNLRDYGATQPESRRGTYSRLIRVFVNSPANTGGTSIVGYRFEISRDGVNWKRPIVPYYEDSPGNAYADQDLSIAGSGSREYRWYDGQPGTQYRVRAYAVNRAGRVSPPAELRLTTQPQVAGEPVAPTALRFFSFFRPVSGGGLTLSAFMFCNGPAGERAGTGNVILLIGDQPGQSGLVANSAIGVFTQVRFRTKPTAGWQAAFGVGTADATEGFGLDISRLIYRASVSSPLRLGRTYYARAFYQRGNTTGLLSPVSDEIQFHIPPLPGDPSPLETFTVTALSYWQIRMQWTVPADQDAVPISKFEIQFSPNDVDWYSLIVLGPDKREVTLAAGIDPSTTYYYRGRIVNEGDRHSTWVKRAVTTPAAAPNRPTAPRNVDFESDSDIIEFAFSPPLSLGGARLREYVIERSHNGVTYGHAAYGRTEDETWDDHLVIDGNTYYYRFVAINERGAYGQPRLVVASTTRAYEAVYLPGRTLEIHDTDLAEHEFYLAAEPAREGTFSRDIWFIPYGDDEDKLKGLAGAPWTIQVDSSDDATVREQRVPITTLFTSTHYFNGLPGLYMLANTPFPVTLRDGVRYDLWLEKTL